MSDIFRRLKDIELSLALGNDLQGVSYEDVLWLCDVVRDLMKQLEDCKTAHREVWEELNRFAGFLAWLEGKEI